MIKRFLVATALLALATPLSSCGTVSGVVADAWPHWAGGEPADAPPRPGQPGYAAFISHNGQVKDPTAPAAAAAAPANATATPTNTTTGTVPPAVTRVPNAQSVVQQGGLY